MHENTQKWQYSKPLKSRKLRLEVQVLEEKRFLFAEKIYGRLDRYYGVLPYADFVNTIWLLESADLFLFRGETAASAAVERIAILR